jgi:hypothetical protein
MGTPYYAYTELPTPAPPGAYARAIGPGGDANTFKYVAEVGGDPVGLWLPADYAERISDFVRHSLGYPCRLIPPDTPLWVGDLTFQTPDKIIMSPADLSDADWLKRGVNNPYSVIISGSVSNNGTYQVASVTSGSTPNDTLNLVGTPISTNEGPVAATAKIQGDTDAFISPARAWAFITGKISGGAPAGTPSAPTISGGVLVLNTTGGVNGDYSRALMSIASGIGVTDEILFMVAEANRAVGSTSAFAHFYVAPNNGAASGGGAPLLEWGTTTVDAPVWVRNGSGTIYFAPSYIRTGDSNIAPTQAAFATTFAELQLNNTSYTGATSAVKAEICRAWNADYGPTEDAIACRQSDCSGVGGSPDNVGIWAQTDVLTGVVIFHVRRYLLFRMT